MIKNNKKDIMENVKARSREKAAFLAGYKAGKEAAAEEANEPVRVIVGDEIAAPDGSVVVVTAIDPESMILGGIDCDGIYHTCKAEEAGKTGRWFNICDLLAAMAPEEDDDLPDLLDILARKGCFHA